jgi:lipopolysaccharide biosynthesis protein
VKRAHIKLINASGLFDRDWYLDRNPDVRAVGMDALVHYLLHGAFEGRDPNPYFDSDWYLDHNPHLRLVGINPLLHYLRQGAAAGFDPCPAFSSQWYLATNPDVAAAGVNPLAHYLKYGAIEGRKIQGARMDPHRLPDQHLPASNVDGFHQIYLDDYLAEYQRRFAVACGARDAAYASVAIESPSWKHPSVKPIAFYLPQMHPIPENDRAWGKGFTEWTNVAKATPQFRTHYQPRLPGELGYYDLRQPDVMHRQIELAKLYGLYAFCFHYYWFNGRRLLRRPLDMFLNDPTMNFRFCVCWANENWTKRWDGHDQEILIAQRHSKQDHQEVFSDLLPYIQDQRYVCVDGRPVIVVYRPAIITELDALVNIWREQAVQVGLPGLYLVATNSFGFCSPEERGFDAICEFPPHGLDVGRVNTTVSMLNPHYSGSVYQYGDVVTAQLNKLALGPSSGAPRFPGVMPGWDNEARRPGRGNVFHDSTPALFQSWLSAAAVHVASYYPPSHRFIFINAWNEWAEGAYLEPDRRFGYAYLAALRNVMEKFTIDPTALLRLAENYNSACRTASCDTAVCLHIFYPNLIPEFAYLLAEARRVRRMDVIASIPNTWTEDTFSSLVNAIRPIRVLVSPNVGRDVWPFVQVLRVAEGMGYEFGCKIHSKMSTHLIDGPAWRARLLDSVLAPAVVEKLGQLFFQRPNVGFAAMEQSFNTLANSDTLFNNLANMNLLMARLGISRLHFREFVAGSMFWFRFQAFRGIAESNIDASWFDEELGQIDGTMAHAFERIFTSYIQVRGYEVVKYP